LKRDMMYLCPPSNGVMLSLGLYELLLGSS
jgi:hypothetical protein